MTNNQSQNTLLKILAKPNARMLKYQWMDKNVLKIELTAPPVENKANECLIKFLSEKLLIPSGTLKILGGRNSRHKFVLIPLPPEIIHERLK